MRKLIYLLFVSALLSCNDDAIISNDNTNNEEEVVIDNEVFEELNLTSELQSTNLPARLGFEMIEFNGEYWFMGGEDAFLKSNNTFHNDIWKSNDGQNWQKVVDNAPWQERADFNLLKFDNKLWIIGGTNNNDLPEWLNDVWSSEDGITWTQVTNHGPWQKRESMSVNVHDNKMYLIGGHSLTNWHLYQDIWESTNGRDWTLVGNISDDLLGTESARQGIHEQTVIKLNGEYFLIAGQLASIFTGHKRVLKSKDMINWEVASMDTPWKDFKYSAFGNIRPFVFKGNLVLVIERTIEIINNFPLEVIPAEYFVFSSVNGITWEEELTLDKLPANGNALDLFMKKPRSLVIDGKAYLYGSYQASFVNPSIDNQVHRFELSNN